ncbi:hypothetical protein DFH07DRAFT_953458 [Mycena maculata]|uniref:Secreted protein n=1 Tax=Mycena maculata TaxID=230809 RepID=A0AAD7NQI5_9AGAR|nr:hypothetical protein DFH07DRAFT_953458 [Mycena maculata]
MARLGLFRWVLIIGDTPAVIITDGHDGEHSQLQELKAETLHLKLPPAIPIVVRLFPVPGDGLDEDRILTHPALQFVPGTNFASSTLSTNDRRCPDQGKHTSTTSP